jgi:DNA (cytosine-5)-methyltransferase 3A
MSTKCEIEIHTIEKYLELKYQGFEFEGQSYLFWEYMRILTEIRKYNPDVKFLLENVEMGKKWERVLSEAIGVYPVHINSALVSSQNRKRIYWTNFKTEQRGLFGELHSDIPQPKDRGILLKDILESEVDEKYYLSEKMLNYFENNAKIQKLNKNGFSYKPHFDLEVKGKSITTKEGSRMDDNFVCVAMRGRNPDNPSDRTTGAPTEQRLEPNLSGKTNCLTGVQKDNLILQVPEATSKGFIEVEPGECFDFENPNSTTRRGRKMEYKSNCLMAKETDFMQFTPQHRIRRLTPTECARLQTIPDWYRWDGMSNSQQYRVLGNGWTVAVISHIISQIDG